MAKEAPHRSHPKPAKADGRGKGATQEAQVGKLPPQLGKKERKTREE